MFLRDLKDVRRLFSHFKGTFLGVGMTAYARITPGYFLDGYHIVSLRKTRDLSWLRKKVKVFSLEEAEGRFLGEEDLNSVSLLSHPFTKRYLQDLPHPKYFLLYQNYPGLEGLAGHEDWILMANPASLRMQVADRAFFHNMVKELQINRIPGQIVPFEALFSQDYESWTKKVSSAFVIHLLEIQKGGGRGTFFIHSMKDYRHLQQRLKGGIWRGSKLTRISIHPFLEGVSASLALCLTKHGILYSGLQRQLIDLPYCEDIWERGVFCGHAWGETQWPSQILEEARRQGGLIGNYLARMGYRGIVGIDFLITKDLKKIYPLECNPRYTGAFPMLSQLHLGQGIIPMDVFHMLEFLGVPYEIDIDLLNSRYEKDLLRGSHLILFALTRGGTLGGTPLNAGLYQWDPEEDGISYIGGASDYTDFQNDNQFIIIDGPPDIGGGKAVFQDPLYRLCRLLFPHPILHKGGGLSLKINSLVKWAYGMLFNP